MEEKPQKNPELEKCEKEKEEYLNGWKRAKADLINYQKEETKRFEEVVKFANAGLLRDLISVLDSFAAFEKNIEGEPRPGGRDLAKNSLEEKGVLMIKAQLEDIMKKQGIEKISAKPGDSFDPNLHESVGEAESDHPPGAIAEEIAKGYLLSGRVIRPVRVKISKSKNS